MPLVTLQRMCSRNSSKKLFRHPRNRNSPEQFLQSATFLKYKKYIHKLNGYDRKIYSLSKRSHGPGRLQDIASLSLKINKIARKLAVLRLPHSLQDIAESQVASSRNELMSLVSEQEASSTEIIDEPMTDDSSDNDDLHRPPVKYHVTLEDLDDEGI